MNRPVIGLTTSTVPEVWKSLGNLTIKNYSTAADYCRCVEAAGGMPICLPNTPPEISVDQILGIVDGLIFTGGGDINPLLFGEEPIPEGGQIDPERDDFEIALAKKAISKGCPVFGVCRGVQTIAVAAGGTIFQDVHAQGGAKIKHYQVTTGPMKTHSVNVKKGSLMEKILGGTKITVNSHHHQAARKLPDDFIASVIAEDGIIEGIERKSGPLVAGVQWHPELLPDDPSTIGIFKAIVQAASKK